MFDVVLVFCAVAAVPTLADAVVDPLLIEAVDASGLLELAGTRLDLRRETDWVDWNVAMTTLYTRAKASSRGKGRCRGCAVTSKKSPGPELEAKK